LRVPGTQPAEINVPRARRNTCDGKTDALIAGTYLAGTNTRRVPIRFYGDCAARNSNHITAGTTRRRRLI
jgi:hypothetical protein